MKNCCTGDESSNERISVFSIQFSFFQNLYNSGEKGTYKKLEADMTFPVYTVKNQSVNVNIGAVVSGYRSIVNDCFRWLRRYSVS